jgi:hypothetical protein
MATKKAIATAPGQPTEYVDLTPAEEAAKIADEALSMQKRQDEANAEAARDAERAAAASRVMVKLGVTIDDLIDLKKALASIDL